MEKRDWLAWGALISALVVTASAEWSLAVACGFHPWIAAGVPASLDIYAVRSLRAKRDVPYVVGSMIVVQALAHLVAAGMLGVSVWLVVLVSCVAPLVLWRVHALGVQTHVSSETRSGSQGLTEVSTDQVKGEPAYEPLRSVESPTEAMTHGDSEPDSEVSTGKLSDSEARGVIEQCFREGVSTRRTAELATRSQTHVSRVFRELKAA
jgi:hypothetical protein